MVSVLLYLFTFGIYAIYWFIKLTDETNALAKEEHKTTSGGKAFLLCLVTFGIYGIYWAYRMGQKTADIGGSQDMSIIYLLLSLVGFSVVAYVLTQMELNRHANC